MIWQKYNPNPAGRSVGDCAIRAIAKALNVDWEKAFAMIVSNAYQMADMPSSNSVWGSILFQNGFERHTIESSCPDCYTAEDFINDCPNGIYVLGFGNHVATVVVKDGRQILYDSWDSSQEIPQYYWSKVEE